ncbi:hypothetical protein [Hyphococcus sp.]|uniref:M61 family metallopeptidase n=1 Tax=Hyphococcus sp. TaxID=2038636 RepID=UPI003D1502E9
MTGFRLLGVLGALMAMTAQANADSYAVEFVASRNPENKGQYRIANVEAVITPDGGIVGLFRDQRDVGLPHGWATFLYTIEVHDQSGAELKTRYLAGGRWKVLGWQAGPVTVNYTMLLQHDRFPNDPGDDEIAYGRPYGVMWTGRALFMEGAASEEEIGVSFDAPESWRFTTPWEQVSSDGRDFTAKNTDDLLDSAFMGGEHLEEILPVAGNEARLAVAPPLHEVKPVMVSTLKHSLGAYEKLFDAPMPEALLVIVGDASFSGGGVMGRSISIVLGDDENNLPAYIAAHEGFHVWNVQWTLEQNNGDMEWLKEGLAEYYANVTRLRGGDVSEEEFLAELGNRAGIYLTALQGDSIAGGGARKLRDAGSYNLVYSGGMMLCAALDAEIRRASDGAKSLDDLMRDLHRRYAGGAEPLTMNMLTDILKQEYSVSAAEFFAAHLYGGEALPLEDLLGFYGLNARISEKDGEVAVNIERAAKADSHAIAAWRDFLLQ